MPRIINSFHGEYEILSNFYFSPMNIEGVEYQTNEHYYQSRKTTNPLEIEGIINAKTPRIAKRLGGRCKIRSNWNKLKNDIMLYGLRHKFSDPRLSEFLKSTEDSILIEGNNWNDTYWGVCNGIGKNWLGILLMQVRNEL